MGEEVLQGEAVVSTPLSSSFSHQGTKIHANSSPILNIVHEEAYKVPS